MTGSPKKVFCASLHWDTPAPHLKFTAFFYEFSRGFVFLVTIATTGITHRHLPYFILSRWPAALPKRRHVAEGFKSPLRTTDTSKNESSLLASLQREQVPLSIPLKSGLWIAAGYFGFFIIDRKNIYCNHEWLRLFSSHTNKELGTLSTPFLLNVVCLFFFFFF